MECEDDGTDTEHTTKYLDRDQVRKLVDLGRLFKQSGQTILNLLFQIEEVSENKASDDELIRSLGKDDVIGCLLLSSKVRRRQPSMKQPTLLLTHLLSTLKADISF